MLSIVILTASILACLMVGGLVISRGLNDRKVIIYGLLTISLLVMSISNFFSLDITNNQLFFVRGVMVSSTIVAYLAYLLIYALKERHNSKSILKWLMLILTLSVIIVDCTNFLFPAVEPGNPPLPILGPGIVLYFAHFATVIALSIKHLASDIRLAKKKREKNQYIMLILGFLPAILIAPITSFILPRFGITETVIYTPLFAVIFVFFVGYAIVRHGLFDVRTAVIRTTTYIMSLITLAAIYYCVAYFLSVFLFKENVSSSISVSPMNIALALALAFIFQPIKKFFDKFTNKFFYKDNYSSDDFFARLNKILSSTIDLRALIERIAIEIGNTIKGEQAFLFIYTDNGHYMSAGTPGHKQLPKSDADQLRSEIIAKKDIIIASLLEDSNATRRLMISHRIELIMPLIQDEEVVGYLCLGEHKTSNYTNRDIKVLNTIANELIIAIQNALAVQEIREFNETLKQRIANATVELRASNRMLRQLDKAKDEFVGMASHQLRTPLTSVKGYISMVIDGDAGKITDPQKQLLDEAFKSSERMVNLINDFLNVSRIQTGKFMLEKSSVDLSKLVEQEIGSLQSSATAHNLKFIYNQPEDFPMVDVDESKIRQVVMNFIDNSIYYSPEDTTVEIKLLVESNEAVFTVKDNGIGVPVGERGQLFTKFYRASNARKRRPDGTGVGLYLAKKIIDAHDGKIIFSSNEGTGSTFGFKLPLK